MHPNPDRPTGETPPVPERLLSGDGGAIPAQGDGGPSSGHVAHLDEREKRIEADYEWCLHSPYVQQAYGGKVVAVCGQKVWGAGPNHAAALEAALLQPGCPPRRHIALVVVPEPADEVVAK